MIKKIMRKSSVKSLESFLLGGAILALLLFAVVFQPRNSYALPAFARQLDVNCNECHTVWPRLNSFGRHFMAMGYIQKGAHPGFPIAAKFATFDQWNTTSSPPPSSTTNKFLFPNEVTFAIGEAVLPKVGVFGEVNLDQIKNPAGGTEMYANFAMERVAISLSEKHPSSIVFFKGSPFEEVDPNISLGNLILQNYLTPGTLGMGYLYDLDDLSDYGVALSSYFTKDNRWYGAVGLSTGGLVSNNDAAIPGNPFTTGAYGTNDSADGALSYFGRIAYEGDVGQWGGTFNIGAAGYYGEQSSTLQLPGTFYNYNGSIQRTYLDAGLQIPTDMYDSRWFELVTDYGYGQDQNVHELNATGTGVLPPFNGEIKGFYAETDWVGFNMVTPFIAYDHTTLTAAPSAGLEAALGAVNTPSVWTTNTWEYGIQYYPPASSKMRVQLWYQPYSDNLGNAGNQVKIMITKWF